eukprot:TRINITY_DN2719_c0_g1_i1.p2 TRINITY_DN2719_c0_g1~~TRINITY_DN2719_c0_g1_i1.p2  ORF type:complete len:120 (+),score=17.32 TRINITY_DN2719_c0_g1_i1:87-446(+)
MLQPSMRQQQPLTSQGSMGIPIRSPAFKSSLSILIDTGKYLAVMAGLAWLLALGSERLGYNWQWYRIPQYIWDCLLYTSDAADEEDSVDLGGRRVNKKKKKIMEEREKKGQKQQELRDI